MSWKGSLLSANTWMFNQTDAYMAHPVTTSLFLIKCFANFCCKFVIRSGLLKKRERRSVFYYFQFLKMFVFLVQSWFICMAGRPLRYRDTSSWKRDRKLPNFSWSHRIISVNFQLFFRLPVLILLLTFRWGRGTTF